MSNTIILFNISDTSLTPEQAIYIDQRIRLYIDDITVSYVTSSSI